MLSAGAALTTVATRHSNYYLPLLAHWEGEFLTNGRMSTFRTLEHQLDHIRHA